MVLFQEPWRSQTAIRQNTTGTIRMLIPFRAHPGLVYLGEPQQSEV
jgi:hypothetical protein